jgi:hypothetical protein
MHGIGACRQASDEGVVDRSHLLHRTPGVGPDSASARVGEEARSSAKTVTQKLTHQALVNNRSGSRRWRGG